MARSFPHIKGLLLDYLSRHGEMTGYAFLRYCREEGMPVSNGTVYPHLKHLMDHGMLSARKEGQRVFYQISDPELYPLLDACAELLVSEGRWQKQAGMEEIKPPVECNCPRCSGQNHI